MAKKSTNPASPDSSGAKTSRNDAPSTKLEPRITELATAIRERAHQGGRSREGLLRQIWELGRLIEAKIAGQTDQSGSKNRAKSLGVDHSRFNMARKIYKAYPTEEAIKRLLARRRADGTALPTGLVDHLCTVSKAADRETLIDRACRENWSEYDVKNNLKASRRGQTQVRTGGRKLKPLRPLPLTLARWQREAERLIRSIEATSGPEVVAGLLDSTDATTVTASHLQDVRRSFEGVMAAITLRLKVLDEISTGLASPGPQTEPTTPPAHTDPGAGPGHPKTVRATRRSKGSAG